MFRMIHINLESNVWRIFLLTLNFTSHVLTFPSGGPSYSCRSLIPGHSNGTQPDPPPYTIVVSSPTLEAGGNTRVSLESTSDIPFLGFMCAVSELSDQKNDPIGTMFMAPSFQQPDLLQTVSCARADPNTAVTHTSRQEKMRVEFDWMSPVNASDGQRFKLRCTVVQSYFKCWTNLQQDLIIISNQGGSQPEGTGSEVTRTPTNRPADVTFTGTGNNLPTQNNGDSDRSGVNGPIIGDNNSVSRDGLLTEIENNILASEHFRQTVMNNDNNNINSNNNLNLQNRILPPMQLRVGQENRGNNFVLNPDRRLNVTPLLGPSGARDSAFRLPSSRVSRPDRPPPPTLNQINNLSQFPSWPITNSLNEQNSNFNTNSPGLSNFERAVILELMRMGVDFFPSSENRFQQNFQRVETNNNGNVGRFGNTGTQNLPNSRRFAPLNSAINANPFPSNTANSRFQDSSLIRGETQVFDPSFMQRPSFRRETMFGNRNNNDNPNSRGLFQLSNARLFNSEFSRIRRRNR